MKFGVVLATFFLASTFFARIQTQNNLCYDVLTSNDTLLSITAMFGFSDRVMLVDKGNMYYELDSSAIQLQNDSFSFDLRKTRNGSIHERWGGFDLSISERRTSQRYSVEYDNYKLACFYNTTTLIGQCISLTQEGATVPMQKKHHEKQVKKRFWELWKQRKPCSSEANKDMIELRFVNHSGKCARPTSGPNQHVAWGYSENDVPQSVIYQSKLIIVNSMHAFMLDVEPIEEFLVNGTGKTNLTLFQAPQVMLHKALVCDPNKNYFAKRKYAKFEYLLLVIFGIFTLFLIGQVVYVFYVMQKSPSIPEKKLAGKKKKSQKSKKERKSKKTKTSGVLTLTSLESGSSSSILGTTSTVNQSTSKPKERSTLGESTGTLDGIESKFSENKTLEEKKTEERKTTKMEGKTLEIPSDDYGKNGSVEGKSLGQSLSPVSTPAFHQGYYGYAHPGSNTN